MLTLTNFAYVNVTTVPIVTQLKYLVLSQDKSAKRTTLRRY